MLAAGPELWLADGEGEDVMIRRTPKGSMDSSEGRAPPVLCDLVGGVVFTALPLTLICGIGDGEEEGEVEDEGDDNDNDNGN